MRSTPSTAKIIGGHLPDDGYFLGTLQIQPILGGALIDQLGLPLNAIGAIFAAELMAMAIACGISALFMASVDRRRFALVALLILALGNVLSTQLHSQAGLLLCRMICGASGGAVMAVVYASAALRTSKDATFAVINIGNLMWGMLLVTSMPLILKSFGVNGAFSSWRSPVCSRRRGAGGYPSIIRRHIVWPTSRHRHLVLRPSC